MNGLPIATQYMNEWEGLWLGFQTRAASMYPNFNYPHPC